MDYPDTIHLVAEDVSNSKSDIGIIICGSGNGANMTANKHENIRSALGGLSTDRRSSEVTHVIDQMSRDEIVARLSALQQNYPQAFTIQEDVEDAQTRDESLELIPSKTEG